MDTTFQFLGADGAELLNDVLSRRHPALYERVRRSDTVSRSDAELIMAVLSDEFTKNPDADWEPTEHGLAISAVMTDFNRAMIDEWP